MYMTWLTVTHPPATPKLGGLRVVLTRPRDDGLSLAQAIEHAGGNVLHLPSLVLEALSDPQPALDIVRRLNHFQLAVFVSKNAARFGVPMIQAHGGFPQGMRVIAVGPATASTLTELGCPNPSYPEGRHDSEGLLAMPELQGAELGGRSVVIFRGQGGLETLAVRLRERGAMVEYAELYRRTKPTIDMNQIAELQKRGTVDLILVTSSDALLNLFAMVGEDEQRWLTECQFLVPSARVAASAREIGVRLGALVSAGMSDEAFMRQIRRWYSEIQKETTG